MEKTNEKQPAEQALEEKQQLAEAELDKIAGGAAFNTSKSGIKTISDGK